MFDEAAQSFGCVGDPFLRGKALQSEQVCFLPRMSAVGGSVDHSDDLLLSARSVRIHENVLGVLRAPSSRDVKGYSGHKKDIRRCRKKKLQYVVGFGVIISVRCYPACGNYA